MFCLYFVYHILWCCVLCIYTFLSRFQLLIMNEMMIFVHAEDRWVICFSPLFICHFPLYGIHVYIHIFVHTMEACNKDYYIIYNAVSIKAVKYSITHNKMHGGKTQQTQCFFHRIYTLSGHNFLSHRVPGNVVSDISWNLTLFSHGGRQQNNDAGRIL